MIALACYPRIGEPVETRRQTFDHAACLPSPRTGNGWHDPQSAVGSRLMREPCGPQCLASAPEKPNTKPSRCGGAPGGLWMDRREPFSRPYTRQARPEGQEGSDG